MKNKLFILTIASVFGVASSCNEDDLEKNTNPNNLTTETFYKNEAQALSAVNAVYAGLQANNLYNREYFFLHDLLSDDNQSGGPQLEAPRGQILNHVFDASNPLVLAVWRGLYRMIHRSNLVIENVPKADDVLVPPALKNRIVGEARFLRAWAYFDLVSLWGRVPLMTEVATAPADNKARSSSEDEVYAVIFEDLTYAAENLPLRYTGSDIGRATKGAAQALAARAHMFRGEYAEARPLLNEVITSGVYSLIPNFIENFREENEFNSESLFEVQFTEAFGDSGGWNADGSGIAEITFRGQEYGPNAWRNVIPSNSLVAEFETVANGATKDDPRRASSFYFIGDQFANDTKTLTTTDVQGDVTKPSWKKYQMIYKRDTENSRSGINMRVIRYADVLLMMAECENELTGPVAALPYINQVRARATMPLYPTAQYPASTKEEMLRAIVHERRVELAGEQIRNRDIRRWRKQGKLAAEPIAGFQSGKHELLPIPLEEIDNNSSLTNADQNPGY
ncbi:RagB/SusD family nutrient uptake outer membrane protein [Rhodocytophaga aerolata]|uniref:RagB/SusD family nutrient uptake outer membrane protein n=1 Tax=Rhodocytophaga aerolata TaxID=455078 RepID=A0ABT8RBK6_9BACT|nr:RagB/SusD family nutrient uptake outer membrane protein [Rhodocytophaga aerolata]MDO1448704.1 RagB/SusD family nutrient uptake outer membrane protein [Rhodocytophaga aerolata]